MIYYNHPYEVVVTVSPSSPTAGTYGCYGIKNVVTLVVEAYIGQLARAKLTCDQYARDLKEGLKSDRDEALALLAAIKEAEGAGPAGGGSPLN